MNQRDPYAPQPRSRFTVEQLLTDDAAYADHMWERYGCRYPIAKRGPDNG
jgi:hypothetical protein